MEKHTSTQVQWVASLIQDLAGSYVLDIWWVKNSLGLSTLKRKGITGATCYSPLRTQLADGNRLAWRLAQTAQSCSEVSLLIHSLCRLLLCGF